MKSKAIQAVIFDLDGIVIDTQRIALAAWRRAISSHGFSPADEVMLRLVGRNRRDADEILVSWYGSRFSAVDARQLAQSYLASTVESQGVPAKRGLLELLAYLERNEMPTALATSTSRSECMQLLEKAKLASRFGVITCGDEVRHGKPSPEIFLTSARKLGVKPDSCIVLEDSFPGIRGAHAAAMMPVMVPDMMEPDVELRRLCFAVVADLLGAKALIEDLIERSVDGHREFR